MNAITRVKRLVETWDKPQQVVTDYSQQFIAMNQIFKYTTVISSKWEQLPLFRRHTRPPTQCIITSV
jgi:hypothetical protein